MFLTGLWSWFFFYLGLGLALGTVLYRSDFCMAGILRDIFLFKDYERLRHLFLAMALTLFFFLLLRTFGTPPPDNFFIGQKSYLLGGMGGVVFGFGMVLAGGCVIGSLYKLAGGNLTYLLVFTGIVLGSLLYAELHPWLRALGKSSSWGGNDNLLDRWPGLVGGSSWMLAGILLLLFLWWWRQGKWTLGDVPDGYLQPWRTAIVLALLNLAAYGASGLPLSVSTMYAKLGALMAEGFAPTHVAALEYFNRPTFAVTIGETAFPVSGGPQVDFYTYTEGGLMLGVLLGAFLNALWRKEFRLSGWPPRRQGASALTGGILMALGARMANGCNIKHLLGGVPLLSLHSLLFVCGMLVGAWLGAQLLPRIILR
ncbi:MAG: YeeE/YedE thiosulfate transporter family protein [Syntrophotalea sp.]|uniref:YeeE/YedE thiosulfate transporter family protein n=1 Tax=Syntrophotalea sp. TaxID=2812029 RepID=UPI003D0EE390